MELSVKDLRALLCEPPNNTPQQPREGFLAGEKVLIRTVTHTYTGLVQPCSDPRFLRLDSAAWIADSGRWANAIEDGTLNEVEPMGDDVLVSIGAIVDITPWVHDLPTEQQ